MSACPSCYTPIDYQRLDPANPVCPHCRQPLIALPPERVPGPGFEVPGYQLDRKIGQGGMGEVWAATQTSLGRKVAIKVLTAQLARDPHFLSRFEQEAKALARLNHPNIVRIYDFIPTDQTYSIIMEYVESPGGDAPTSLDHLILEGPLEQSLVSKFLTQLLHALHDAHERQVIHRDVKPSNVMIDLYGNVKIVDFGIAAVHEADNERHLTRGGSRMGTVDYMSPEQATDAKSVDHRTDIYSCGVMLYEMLTGTRPRGAFEPPSKLRPELPAAWDGIVHRALQSQREKRFGDALEMATAIQQVAQARRAVTTPDLPPVTVVPPSDPTPVPPLPPVVENRGRSDRTTSPPQPGTVIESAHDWEEIIVEDLSGPRSAAPRGPIKPAPPPPRRVEDHPQARPDSLPDHTCHECRQPVPAQADYCNRCGATVRFKCVRCGAVSQGGIKYCPGCGVDVFKARQYDSLCKQAVQELRTALQDQLPVVDRFSAADRAQVTLSQAASYLPEHETAHDLMAQAGTLSRKLAWEIAESALHNKHYAAARDHYQYVLQVETKHPGALKRLGELERVRKALVFKAKEYFKREQYERAASGLQSACEWFFGDEELESLREQALRYAGELKIAKDRIEQLEREKRRFELLEYLETLCRSNVGRRKGIADYASKLRKQLDEVERQLITARTLLRSGQAEQALHTAEQVLAYVSDYPAAEQLAREAQAELNPSSGCLMTIFWFLILAGLLVGAGYLTYDYWPAKFKDRFQKLERLLPAQNQTQ